MLKVIIVDDEAIIRLGVREVINWEQFGCEIVGEFSNGESALTYIMKNQVDLAIVDIQMPVMDGVHFVETLSKQLADSAPSVIMLSAYSDYEYVRKVFLNGVLDYVVKDQMENEAFSVIISNAVTRIKNKKQSNDNLVKENSLLNHKRTEQYISDYFQHANEWDETNEHFEGLSKQLRGTKQIVLSILVSRYKNMDLLDSNQIRLATRTVKQMADKLSQNTFVFDGDEGEILIIYYYAASESLASIRHKLANWFTELVSHTKNFYNVSLNLGVAEPTAGIKNWAKSKFEAERLAKLRFFKGYDHVFYWEKLQTLKEVDEELAVKQLLTQITNHNSNWKEEYSNWYLNLLQKDCKDIEKVTMQYRNLLLEAISILLQNGSSWDHLNMASDRDPFEQLKDWETLNQVHSWMFQVLQQIEDNLLLESNVGRENIPFAQKVEQFLDVHYKEPISLRELADHLGLSESYVSKLILRETGKNFIDMLTSLRVEKAKQLISKGMKFQDIGMEVGYPNPSHFSRVFKKVTDESPNQYKHKLNHTKTKK